MLDGPGGYIDGKDIQMFDVLAFHLCSLKSNTSLKVGTRYVCLLANTNIHGTGMLHGKKYQSGHLNYPAPDCSLGSTQSCQRTLCCSDVLR